MRLSLYGFLGLSILATATTSGNAAGPELAQRLTADIDKVLAADWSARRVTPAADVEDADFARRVYLDLIGRAPRVAETRAFLADKATDKRAKLVERLLVTPSHASHFAAVTRSDWLPQTQTDPQFIYLGFQFEGWLQTRFAKNEPLDETIRMVLTTDVNTGRNMRAVAYNPRANNFALNSFYQANQLKPENLAANVSRAFMGVRLECAQCHDHPFAPITREHFWEFAAFFAEFAPLPPVAPSFVGPLEPQFQVNRLQIPNTPRYVTAAFPDGTAPEWKSGRTPRKELAEWMTAAKNPYFAKNLANRLWTHFFGTELMDPVGEAAGEAPPPTGLLDTLAKALIESGYDQRAMMKAITASKAYQRSSKLSEPSQLDPRRFAKMSVKGLTSNQIYDSFISATGHRDLTPRNQQFYNVQDDGGRGSFRTLFNDPGKPTETQTSILQALMLMNGKAMADQTSLDRSEVLAAVVDAPFLDTSKRVETLFLAALTRKPTPEELEKFSSYVDRGGPSGDKAKALSDVFWVLLNSTEFLFNH